MKLFTIRPDHLADQKAKGWHFQIYKERDGKALIFPIKRDGGHLSENTAIRLCRWIPTDHLEEVLPRE